MPGAAQPRLSAERGKSSHSREVSSRAYSMVKACAAVPSAGMPYRRRVSKLDDAAKPANQELGMCH